MAKGNEEERVRSIEYVASDFAAGHAPGQPDDEAIQRRPRPWVALAVSGVAVLLAIGAVSAFGALRFDDPTPPEPQDFASGAQSDPDSPPETLPPRLVDSVPNLTDRLTLVALVGDSLQTLLWDPSFRVPKAYDLPIATSGPTSGPLVDIDASFDSAGRTVAVVATSTQSTRAYLGAPTDVGAIPDIIAPKSLVWHASQVGSIAWVVPGEGGQWGLHTGKVDPLSGEIVDDVTVAVLPSPVGLVRWDSAGFVLNQGSSTIAIDGAGEKMWEQAGVATSGSASIVAIIAPDDSASETRWVITDRLTGEPTDHQVIGAPGETWVTTSRDTDLIAEIASTTNGTRITVGGPGIATKRIVQVDLDVMPIGFTSTGEYLQFELLDSNDLVFVNWNSGATHTVPIPDDTTVIGSDLG